MRQRLVELLWHLLKFKQPFHPEVCAKEEAKVRRKSCNDWKQWPRLSTTESFPSDDLGS